MSELSKSYDVDWSRAACLHTDPEIFFPNMKDSQSKPIIDEAKQYCNSCVIKDDCLRDAIIMDEDWGIWGGMTEKERRALRRKGLAGSAIMRSIADSQK